MDILERTCDGKYPERQVLTRTWNEQNHCGVFQGIR